MGTLGPLSDRVTDPAPLRLPGESPGSEAPMPTGSSRERGRPGSGLREGSGRPRNPASDTRQWRREPLPRLPSSSVLLWPRGRQGGGGDARPLSSGQGPSPRCRGTLSHSQKSCEAVHPDGSTRTQVTLRRGTRADRASASRPGLLQGTPASLQRAKGHRREKRRQLRGR